jgi:hypothetical protein
VTDTLQTVLDGLLPRGWNEPPERRRRFLLLTANFLGHPKESNRRRAAERAVADTVETTPDEVAASCLDVWDETGGLAERRDRLSAVLSAVDDEWRQIQSDNQSLYVAQVPDHRLGLFADTVDSPYDFAATAGLSDTLAGREQCRLWGVTEAGREPGAFEALERGDVVVFADDERLFAVGLIAETHESEVIAQRIWSTRAYQYIYTLEAYQPIDLSSEHVDGAPAELTRVDETTATRFSDAAGSVWNYLTRFYTTKGFRDRFEEFDQNGESAVGRRLRDDSVSTTAPYYWVDHNTIDDADAEYLQVPRTDEPHHDLQKLTVDDTVFDHFDGRVFGYSEVTTPAYLVTDRDGSEYRRVDVDTTRFDEPVPFSEFYPVLTRDDVRLTNHYPLNDQGPAMTYLHNLSQAGGEYLLGAGGETESGLRRLERRLNLPTLSVTPPESLFFPDGERERLRREIEATLNAGRHLILTGPPGTGKSKLARAIADQAATTDAVDGYTFATATAEWSTFDTVGGYVPDPDDDGLTFDPRLFLNCFRGEMGVENNWLVVDELNRANVDEAFGPFLSVLSGDSVTLPYERDDQVQIDWVDTETPTERRRAVAASNDRFPVTPAWRLVGTTNTVDKASLYDLSFAFVRRFGFVHVGVPTLSTDDGVVRGDLLDPAAGPNYATKWTDDDPAFRETVAEWCLDVAVVWRIVNEYRPIGPAVVRDLLAFLHAYRGENETDALSSAVVNCLFPQLEALRTAEYEKLFSRLGEETTVVDAGGRQRVTPRVDTAALGRTAAEFFSLDTVPS